MTRQGEPTLNELVGLGQQDPLDEFFPTTFTSSSTTTSTLSPPPPPSPIFPGLSPPSSPTGRIRMEDLEDTKGRLARRALSAPYSLRSPRGLEKSRPFGPQFMNSEMFLFKYWPEEVTLSQKAASVSRDASIIASTGTKQSRRTYSREDDRWVDPWCVAANQRPPGWRRAIYKHKGINWQVVDPSGRMPLHWKKEYGIGEKTTESATASVVSPSVATPDNATPRALTSAILSTPHNAASPPFFSTPSPSKPATAKTPKPVASSKDGSGKKSSSGLGIRKVAASNARMASMNLKQLYVESSSEHIAVA